ncbi:MAG: penicillin-binding protein 1A [Acidobacteriaceae bacterium]
MQSPTHSSDKHSSEAHPHRRFRQPLLVGLRFPSRKIAGRTTFFVLVLLAALFGSLAGLMLVYSTDLPQIADLEHYRPSTTTELYDIHGRIFGSFALQRRVAVGYNDFSPLLRQAVISIEDKSFESNWGVNVFRVAGAAYRDLTSDSRSQGASTLTMQLARNLFLTSRRTFGRKLQEVFLSIQIERHFTKKQIFTLYGNQIYLGHGVYGFEAGAQYYFSKHAKDLTLTEAALLAALPKGPEYYSPVRYPDRAFRRRNLVIDQMLEDGAITTEQATAAKAAPLGLRIEPPPTSVAPWFVEEVRRQLEAQFGSEEVHEAGLRVYTTLDLDLQQTANRAVLDGLAAYERRKGWVGHLLNAVTAGSDLDSFHHPDWNLPTDPGSYMHALVTQVSPDQVVARIGKQFAVLSPKDWKWTGFKTTDLFLKRGDIIYLRIGGKLPNGQLQASLEQDSGAQSSLLAVDNSTGEVRAMVGGRDFDLSQFNRATQGERQTGSSFKPYVYTTAVEAGMKPTDTILDAPVTFMTASGPYSPHDYESKYLGLISMTEAFADSRNIPALKLAQRFGVHKVIETAHRFGIKEDIPPYLPIALGSADTTLYEQVAAYSVFPNDGILIEPHYIRKVTSADGRELDEAAPDVKDVISTQTARTMMTLFQAVIHTGTAASAAQLNHPLGGKTGTTNDFTNAWFIGFSPSVTCGVWVGYDEPKSLGNRETGARAALPIWVDFMKAAIVGKPDESFPGETAPTTPKPAGTTTSPANMPAAVRPNISVRPANGGSTAAPASHPSVSVPLTPQG